MIVAKKAALVGLFFFCLFFGKNDRKNEMKTQVIGRFLKLDSLNNNVVVDIIRRVRFKK